jgi:hypothetical protein
MSGFTGSIQLVYVLAAACFVVGPLPGFVELVGSAADATVFFVGSLFFTSAALLQTVEAIDRLDRWSCTIQFAGTIFFNVSTFRALQAGLDANQYDRLVWSPDALGSICFLVSGVLACFAIHGRSRSRVWWITWINLVGCVAFGISAVAGYVVPATGTSLDLAAANAWTSFGALCFLAGAVLLLSARSD